MRFEPIAPPGLVLVRPDVHRDERGFFLEAFHAERYEAAGIPGPWVQDNHSRSARNILRGLHAQTRKPQAKLVRVILGEIWDVAVDIRPGSATFGRYGAVRLSAENHHQIYVPAGFAHGFCVLSESAEVIYKTSDYYDPGGELTIRWDDPDIAIEWPITDPILSGKDRAGKRLAELPSKP